MAKVTNEQKTMKSLEKIETQLAAFIKRSNDGVEAFREKMTTLLNSIREINGEEEDDEEEEAPKAKRGGKAAPAAKAAPAKRGKKVVDEDEDEDEDDDYDDDYDD